MRQTPYNLRELAARLKGKMNLRSLVLTLAVLVVFTTTYLLILPAFTLDKDEAAEQGGIDVVAVETAAEEAKEDAAVETADVKEEVTAETTEEADKTEAEDVKEETSEKKSETKSEEKSDVKLLTKKTTINADQAKGDNFAVSAVVGKDAKVPADVTITATELDKTTDGFDYDQYKKDALKALKKDSSDVKAIKSIKFYDISLESDSQENSVEPSAPVNVKIAYEDGMKVDNADNIRIVHFAEQSNGTEKPVVLDTAENNVETETNASGSKVTEASFDTDGFSKFAVVEVETIEKTVITADGQTYKVSVTYDKNAQVPEGSELEVKELTGEDYDAYLEKTADKLDMSADELSYAKLFDITIKNGDEEVKIAAPVNVEIQLLDNLGLAEDTQVLHFANKNDADIVASSVSGDTVKFEAEGFSIYAIASQGTNDLDGKSFAIVQVNTQANNTQPEENNTIYNGRALSTASQSDNTRLGGTTVKVERHQSENNVTTDNNNTVVTEWKFTKAEGNNNYYITAPDGRYLNISNGVARLTNTAQALTVTPGTGADAGKVRISNGDYRLQSSVAANTNRTVSDTQYFTGGQKNGNYDWMTLYELDTVNIPDDPADSYSGEKVSVQDLKDGEKYIVYKTVYNEQSGEYEDWVIDGNGNLKKAYDQGDSMSLYSDVSPMWTLKICKDSSGNPTGYYIFQNDVTGLCLSPQSGNVIVAPFESDNTSGVALYGREHGEYTSTIEKWDASAMSYYGYEITTGTGVEIAAVQREHSQDFSFAEIKTAQSGLHTVRTVDSAANGITIHMFDYQNRNTISNVTGSDGYGVGVLPAQHVRPTLQNGYPVFTNGNSGSTLFDPTNSYHKGTGNHLFLESVYDSTGYYEYSAFNNFAHYNQDDGTFTVYQETGTPSNESNFYYRRGNFMPYDELDPSKQYSNQYTGDGNLIDHENPNNGSVLYGLKSTNFYFGMTMDFNFLMPKEGKLDGNPLIYEFNGDDDLWIYIDNVLILDIGGVHDAFSGKINFATGEITGGNGGAGGARTIKEAFKNAKVFPDGTAWDDSKVDQYFKGDTFVDYGNHKFNMFYMEHGAGASNLHTRFNLPVIEHGAVVVEKKLDNTTQEKFANVSFAYQIFAKDQNHEYQPLTSAVYENKTDSSGNPVPVQFHPSVVIDGKTYTNVFYLKPNEAAVFSNLLEDEDYYVQEIGIKDDYYDEVLVNDVKIDGETAEDEDGVYKSSVATPRNRARVTYTNHCADSNSNELLITKRLAPGSKDNGDTFEFRVLLERADGVLDAYYQGPYYIKDDNNIYYRFENGALVPNGESPYEMQAGNYGTIERIPPNYTVVIKDLLVGTDFYVDEIRVRPNGSTAPTGVLVGDSDWIQDSREKSDCNDPEITDASIYDYATGRYITGSSLGSIAHGQDAKVVFTNRQKSVDVKLEKVDDKGEKLSGSTFDLTTWTEKTEGETTTGSWTNVTTDIKPGAPADGSTPAVDNPVSLGGLPVGRYKLTETKAPNGYVMLTKEVYFEVYSDNSVLKARLTDADGTAITTSDIATISGTGSGDNTVYTITVKNTPGQELPMTGGIGTTIFYIIGAMLIIGCGATLIRRKKQA